MQIGSLSLVVNENAVASGIRKAGQVVDDVGHGVGEYLGKGVGYLSHLAPGMHIPGGHGLNKGFVKGLHHGVYDADELIDKHIRKPIGRAVGAYDGEKKGKKK